jgi:hypothetical protein
MDWFMVESVPIIVMKPPFFTALWKAKRKTKAMKEWKSGETRHAMVCFYLAVGSE